MNNKIVKVLILIIGFSAFMDASYAERQKTIGDLLGNIKRQSSKVRIEKNKTKINAPKGFSEKRLKVNLQDVRPPSTNSMRLGTTDPKEAKIEEYTDKEIEQLFLLTKKYRKSRARGEIWLRLAEAYVDKARFIEFRIQRKYDEDLLDYQNKKRRSRPRLDLRPAQVYNKKAVELYEWFLRDFPKDEKVDQALFFLGYNHFELNNIQRGLNYYSELIKRFPKSDYVDESHFAIGEYYFEKEQWKRAAPSYRKVLSRKTSQLYSFSMYKLAWCEFKLGKTQAAVQLLKNVIVLGRKSGDKGGRIRLVDEAKMNMVPFYADLPDYQKARQFFMSVYSRGEYVKYLERLAYYYADAGKRSAARHYFKYLIERDPNAPKAYDYHYQIVTMYASSGDTNTFKRELFSWVDKYGPKSRWAQKNMEKNKNLVEKSVALVETTLRTFTLQQHQTAQNSRGKASRESAEEGYQKYFRAFDDTAEMGNMRFYYAELLFDMGKYSNAAQNYLIVSDKYPKSEYYQKAVLNAVLALEKKLPDTKDIKKVVGDSNVPIPLDQTTKVFERVADRYFKAFPDKPEGVAIKYKLASLYYSYNFNDKAEELYKEIALNPPQNKFTESAGNTVLDIYNTKKDYIGLEKAAEEMLDKPHIAKSKFGAQVREILMQSVFKRAQDEADKKNYAASGEMFQNFATKYPLSSLAPNAIFNAAVNFEKAGKSQLAMKNYEQLMSSQNKSATSLKKQSREFLATIYQNSGQFDKAASAFEGIARDTKDNEKKAGYYYNAAVIRMGMRYYTAAIKNFEEFRKLTKTKEREEALFYIGKIWENRRNNKRAIQYYKMYIDANPADRKNVMESAFKIARSYQSDGDKKMAQEWFRRTIAIDRNLQQQGFKGGVPYAADAKFRLSYYTYLELQKINFTKDPAQQARALKSKIEMIDRLAKEMAVVIGYDDGFQIVAALATLGQANQHMAASLYQVPLPSGLNAEEQKQYKEGVATQAKQFSDQAVKLYKDAIQKATEFEAYSEWVKVATSELNRIDSKSYEEFGEIAYLTQLADEYESVKGKSKASSEELEELVKARKSGQHDKVVEIAGEILSDNSNDLYVLNQLILHYNQKEQFGLAKILVDRALEISKDDKVILNNLGVILVAEENLREAISTFRKSLKSDLGYAYATTNLGSIYLDYKDYSRAKAALEEGYDIVKRSLGKGDEIAVEVANNYALALKGLGEYDKANNVFEKIMDENSRVVPVLFNYAILLVENSKKYDDGLKILSRIKVLSNDSNLLKRVSQLEKRAFDAKFK
ncbi:MAG: tetratricopeptide repeat protein [Bdellovibrionales bacterium]